MKIIRIKIQHRFLHVRRSLGHSTKQTVPGGVMTYNTYPVIPNNIYLSLNCMQSSFNNHIYQVSGNIMIGGKRVQQKMQHYKIHIMEILLFRST
jgi:uncharacterized Zn-binding protein involved in type VI secretion